MRLLPSGVFTVVALALLFWLTLAPQPLPENDSLAFPGSDKVAHVIMFGGVYFVMLFDLTGWRRSRGKGKPSAGAALAVGALCLALGGGIELLQGAMHMGRGCDVWDFVADGVGVALSALVTPVVIRVLEP